MDCPKCHKTIPDNSTVCLHCHKVLILTCPNCKSRSTKSVCPNCGYIILEKCSKCGRLISTKDGKCKCGLDVAKSVAYNECETDEFAALTIRFEELKLLRKLLASQELYVKFMIKLKNLLKSQLKDFEGNIILYSDTYVVNFNKELSFPTSVHKAVRLALRILNSFTGINLKIQDELGVPLKLSLLIQKKSAEELLEKQLPKNKVKQLLKKNQDLRYINGMQVILDQYSQDCLGDVYKTDSIYSSEIDGTSVMFYEILIKEYILPPSVTEKEVNISVDGQNNEIPATCNVENTNDIYDCRKFDISAKCKFEKYFPANLFLNIGLDDKILVLSGEKEYQVDTSEICKFYEKKHLKVLYLSCTDDLLYKPWGFFCKLFRCRFGLPETRGLISEDTNFGQFNAIRDLILGNVINSATIEDARYAYIDLFGKFLSSLKNYVIIVDGFENIDDTSIQTMELYFDDFKKVVPNFVFITNKEFAVHKKIKSLTKTSLYKEVTMLKSNIGTLLSDIKHEAEEFIQSAYYEKIKEKFNGSKLYFNNAIKYLSDEGVLISSDNKLQIKNNNSVVVPDDFNSLIHARLKYLEKQKEASMILAYSAFLGERIDFATLAQLGIKNIKQNAKILVQSKFARVKDRVLYINNFNLMLPIIRESIKGDTSDYLLKNIIAKLGKNIDDSALSIYMGNISMHKEEYLLLWKAAQTAIKSGDYDAYLKICLKSLSLIDIVGENIDKEAIDSHKKEIYQNILLSLYSYSPQKTYALGEILLKDAIETDNDEELIKLSNIMLQGALLSSNYTNAHSLLCNITGRMPTPALIVDGVVNTKFLLLQLINIEILFNIGKYRECISIGEEILEVLKPEILEKIKPKSFSFNSFVNHIADTYRLVCFSKIITNDNDLDIFMERIESLLNDVFAEKECIKSIKEYLANINFAPSNIEAASPFSKVVYLLLQELSNFIHGGDSFAKNVYQAKLLSYDINQVLLENICDLLIGFAYLKEGIYKKADSIFSDVLLKAEQNSIDILVMFSKYLTAKCKFAEGETNIALTIVDEVLTKLQKDNNEAKIFYAMFEKLYIELASECISDFDKINEEKKLGSIAPDGSIERIIRGYNIGLRVDNSAADFIPKGTVYNASSSEYDGEALVLEDM